jgi:hypothetical protein
VTDKKTGDDFSHSQNSKGSATNGEYRVRLPDGRMQIVSYTADENGYQANVRYDDEDTTGNRIDSDNYNTHEQYNNHIADSYNDKHNYNDYPNSYNENERKESNDKYNYNENEHKETSNDKYSPPNNDYYNQYPDLSKEYYNDDFSSEFESKNYDYAPHTSKFSSFIDKKSELEPISVSKANFVSSSTVSPSYETLKDLLVTKKAYNTVQPYISNIPVEINVSPTPQSIYDATTERVVLIGNKKPNLYTNIIPSAVPVSATPIPVNYNSGFVVSSTPRNYLVSTIASLRNNVDLSGPKPVLSNSYIDRINKYLRFN